MKYKIAILIHATAIGVRCHRQCRHLVRFREADRMVDSCMAFSVELDKDADGRLLRSGKCIIAQRKASRNVPSKQLDLFAGSSIA